MFDELFFDDIIFDTSTIVVVSDPSFVVYTSRCKPIVKFKQGGKMAERFHNPKISDEKLVLTFDFTNGLDGSETLTGVPTVEVFVTRGKDLDPVAILNGSGVLDATNKKALIPIDGGVPGNAYTFKVIATTSNVLKVLALEGILSVI